MDFSNYKFGCSQIARIMCNARAKWTETAGRELDKLLRKEIRQELSPAEHEKLAKRREQQRNVAENRIILSEGCKGFLTEIFLKELYGNRFRILSPAPGEGVLQMIRGIQTEADGALLLSQVDSKPYYKYKKTIENDYLIAKLDLLDAPDLPSASRIIDIKSSVDAESFFRKPSAPFTRSNIYQMQGYLAITGKKVAELAHCLVGYSDEVINEQRQILFERLCLDGVETLDFQKAWAKAEVELRYADIPISRRVVSFLVDRDDAVIDEIYETIDTCRVWLEEFSKKHELLTSKRYLNAEENNSEHNTDDMGQSDAE
jgi:hypothetical protein